MAAAYVDSTAVEELTGAITETVSLTIAAGTDLVLVVAVIYEQASGQTVTEVRYNGTALTEHANSPFVTDDVSAFGPDMAIFSLADPDTGSALDLVVTFSGATGQDVTIISAICSGAGSIGASGQATDATTIDADRSVSITTANDDSLILAFASHSFSNDSPYSSSTGTEREDGATATGTTGDAYALYTQAAGAAGAKTVTITGTQTDVAFGWNTVAIEVVEAAGGAATHPVNPFGHPLQGPFAGPIGF